MEESKTKTVLIVGPSGPQGKTTLKNALKKHDYRAIELSDIIGLMSGRDYFFLHSGYANGFIVINFTDKPFIPREKRVLNYEMSDEELMPYIKYIQKEQERLLK